MSAQLDNRVQRGASACARKHNPPSITVGRGIGTQRDRPAAGTRLRRRTREVAETGRQQRESPTRVDRQAFQRFGWALPVRAAASRAEPGSGSVAKPSTAGRSPPEVRLAAPDPHAPSTSAAAAAITDVPEPPLGDQKQTSTTRLPVPGVRDGARATASGKAKGSSRQDMTPRLSPSRVDRGRRRVFTQPCTHRTQTRTVCRRRTVGQGLGPSRDAPDR